MKKYLLFAAMIGLAAVAPAFAQSDFSWEIPNSIRTCPDGDGGIQIVRVQWGEDQPRDVLLYVAFYQGMATECPDNDQQEDRVTVVTGTYDGNSGGKNWYRFEFQPKMSAAWWGNTATLNFHVVAGPEDTEYVTIIGPDLDGNGSVNVSDSPIFSGFVQTQNPLGDQNSDGLCNLSDVPVFAAHYGHGCY